MLSVLPRLPVTYIRARSLAKARTAPAAAGGVPDDLPAVGEWGTLNGSTLAASGVANSTDLGGDTGDYTALFYAWSGGSIVTGGIYNGATLVDGTFAVIFGGGHTDYFGNEVYAFGPFESSTRNYYRLRDPTNPAVIDQDVDGSGNPCARHSYSSMGFVTFGGRRWLFCAGQPFRSEDAGSDATCNAFNFAQASPNSNQPWSTKATIGNGSCRTIGIDNTNGVIWYHGPGRVGYYDIATDTNVAYGNGFKSPPGGDNWTSIMDEARGLWIIFPNDGNGAYGYRTNNGISNDYYPLNQTGTKPTGNVSAVYDDVDDRIVCWANGGKTLHFLTPPSGDPYQGGDAWTWSSTTPGSGATPAAANTNGTYGRLGYVKTDSFRGYSLWNKANESVLFYRAG